MPATQPDAREVASGPSLMHAIDPESLSGTEIYKLMTGAVVPRPVAWVGTRSSQGVMNLAPFSSFTFVCHDPPMLAIGIDARRAAFDGLKDTARNILDTGEFVVHMADHSQLAAVHASAQEVGADVSETALLGLATVASVRIATPRLAAAPVAMECVLHQCIELGNQPNRLMIGRVLQYHVRESVLQEGRIDSALLDPICRLGGSWYGRLGEILPAPLLVGSS